MDKLASAAFSLSGLSFYEDILKDDCIAAFTALLRGDYGQNPHAAAQLYGQFYKHLCAGAYGINFADTVFAKILYADNFFARACAAGQYLALPLQVKNAVETELNALATCGQISCDELKAAMKHSLPEYAPEIDALPVYKSSLSKFQLSPLWGGDIIAVAEHYKAKGFGVFAQYASFRLEHKNGALHLAPVISPDKIALEDLLDYAHQRAMVLDNTEALLAGMPTNNILLYGDRGTGKSSTIKAVLNRYAKDGLRLIEVPTAMLVHLGQLTDMLAQNPMKFILFTDDLSFAEHDNSYTALKAILEGSVSKLPANMVIYATSNRRHLLRETFSARAGDEVNLADTRDEAASLSDRFGITITFLAPTKAAYLDMVIKMAETQKISFAPQALTKAANAWAMGRGSFAPRTAAQFISYAKARAGRGLPLISE